MSRIYYSLFVSNQDGKVVELEEDTQWAAEKLAAELKAEGLAVEILERIEASVGLHVGDYNEHAAKRQEWEQY